MRLTAEGMRKSELFWPHHSVSIAAKQPGKRWSAPLKLSEVTGQRDRHRQRHRERPRGWSLARGHPCEEQMEEGDREKDREGEERLRKVSQTCGEAAGWTRELGERGGRQKRQRGGGGHTEAEKTWWLRSRRAMVVAWSTLPPTRGGGGATVETIWIPRSKREMLEGWLSTQWVAWEHEWDRHSKGLQPHPTPLLKSTSRDMLRPRAWGSWKGAF